MVSCRHSLLLSLHGIFVPHIFLLVSFARRRSFLRRITAALLSVVLAAMSSPPAAAGPHQNGKVAPPYSFSELASLAHLIDIFDLSCGVDEHQRRSFAVPLITVAVVTVVDVGCHHLHLYLLSTLGENTPSFSSSCFHVPRRISCTLDDVWLTPGEVYRLYVLLSTRPVLLLLMGSAFLAVS
jgi:hypothetical protein